MATKAQHQAAYGPVPALLRALREAAGLTQRGLGGRLGKPQSWVHNCDVHPAAAFARFLDATGRRGRQRKSPPAGG